MLLDMAGTLPMRLWKPFVAKHGSMNLNEQLHLGFMREGDFRIALRPMTTSRHSFYCWAGSTDVFRGAMEHTPCFPIPQHRTRRMARTHITLLLGHTKNSRDGVRHIGVTTINHICMAANCSFEMPQHQFTYPPPPILLPY